ncbi:hypothetical protein FQN60_016060 [Etheostoma spectabile]|uniref:Uncharacterized protein n=1 Tax=Etheostoma spectabile TaxID=54343 RepID=A0A5J5CDH1_9PERO|nr:hypothetical protein FQN60_016060 [Etheostoma spectabile]
MPMMTVPLMSIPHTTPRLPSTQPCLAPKSAAARSPIPPEPFQYHKLSMSRTSATSNHGYCRLDTFSLWPWFVVRSQPKGDQA